MSETDFKIFEEPIRSEIFTAARLEAHAQSLAAAQTVTANPRVGRDLSARVLDNSRVLDKTYYYLLEMVDEKRAITPAAEWLIDNYHIVRAQINDIRDHLPPKFYRELPKLADGPLAGFPRVYGIAWAYVAHTDSRFDAETLTRFLKAYQQVQPLTIGELWAISITIRVVLIENLRRLAARIAGSQMARREADDLANELLGLKEGPIRSVPEIIEVLKTKPLTTGFAVQLLQRLRFQDPHVDPVMQWLEAGLAEKNLIPDEIVTEEHRSQMAGNATVRNIITSSRSMIGFNWQDLFEDVSLVDVTLRTHATYSAMDFATRNRYRRGIEFLGKHSKTSELDIARLVIEKAAESQRDPGYYLLTNEGRTEIERQIHFTPPWSVRALNFYRAHAVGLYVGGIFTLTFLLLWGPLRELRASGAHGWIYLAALLGFFPAFEVAMAVFNRVTIALLGPRHLPRFSLEHGVPESARAFVVVPTMIVKEDRIDSQLEQLEIHYLSNPEENLYFALLTDWLDSDQDLSPADERLLDSAAKKLEQLNSKYGLSQEGLPRFYIYHRKRLYNAGEKRWMGWERKRGKLQEFNQLLLGHAGTSFIALKGRGLEVPQNIRYVITLDADTRLPNGSALQLIGTMAHPLNKPEFDPHLGRVTKGYGILQPRITPTLPTTEESTVFQKLSTGNSGVDPYASAVSDVYQDLFGEGSFTGKGIYDVAVFEATLKGRTPENALLSHDLFEGNYLRCGFLSDVEFFEDFPSHNEVAVARSHRWTRGDWQLLPWILGRGGRSISALGRFKMFDNLRRSLLAPACFLILLVSFALPWSVSWPWIALALVSLAIGALVSFAAELFGFTQKMPWRQTLMSTLTEFKVGSLRFLFGLSQLPHVALRNVDAITRALYRIYVSQQKMLEWTTAAQLQSAAKVSWKFFWQSYKYEVGFTTLALVVVTMIHPAAFFWALPFWALWLGSPCIALWASTPPKPRFITPLETDDIALLQRAGRRIWRFFATFVTSEDNFLPPDNFQETPDPVIAHRSSPTNFGLYLLSTLTARDFGWIGTFEMVERLLQTLNSMNHLPRFQGHFFNWYETREGRALEPRYISSVDNGNLAGHLLAVSQGCEDILAKPVDVLNFTKDPAQALLLLEEALQPLNPNEALLSLLDGIKKNLHLLSQLTPIRPSKWDDLVLEAKALLFGVEELSQILPAEASEALAWAQSLCHEIDSSARDLKCLFSWMDAELPEFKDESLRLAWSEIHKYLSPQVRLKDFEAHFGTALHDVGELQRRLPATEPALTASLQDLVVKLETTVRYGKQLLQKFAQVSELCHRLFYEMDFSLLYDPSRKLFSIGYRVHENALDASYYDLLASEARLTSFIAIAKGDVPAAHWFSLGRGLTPINNGSVLVSWSGSMFEYLMPSLVMNSPEGSILEQTCHLTVRRQIQYGAEKNIPWGISESAYNKRDVHLTYQYSNFGIPDLGLKRGLGQDLVVAPYATLLAAMFETAAAVKNLRTLQTIGGEGPYGFYEAIDFTPSRLPEGQKSAVVKCYMAHHQGMSLVGIGNILANGIVRERFHAHPLVQAAELLLQERMPRNVGVTKPKEKTPAQPIGFIKEETAPIPRQYHSFNRPVPTTQLLASGDYSVMLTSSGSGYSRYKDVAINRWREDVTKDNWGSYFFYKDVRTKKVWSATYQPTCVEPQYYDVTFFEDRARFYREDDKLQSDLEIFLSPEDPAEIRRVTLTNVSENARELEVTSYFEVVLNQQAADIAHPAFSNLFVQTEFIPEMNLLIATRRPRSAKEKPSCVAHMLVPDKMLVGEVQYETSRAEFLGRGRNVRAPAAMDEGNKLSNTVGAVLDPVMSLRARVYLPPGVAAKLTFNTFAADSREQILLRAEAFFDHLIYERITDLAWTQAQVKLHYYNMEPDEAHLFQRLATRLIYLDSSLRPSGEILKRNSKNVTGLWAFGISGDLPIILVRIDDFEDRGIVRQLLKAHQYLGSKGLSLDLVILNDRAASYTQELQQNLEALVHSGTMGTQSPTSKGKVFVLRADVLHEEDRLLLFASARAVLASRQGNLSEQVERMRFTVDPYSFPADKSPARHDDAAPALGVPELKLFNGLGGFSTNGKEYVIVQTKNARTPAPWINVIANPDFGFLVSESGSGYTWSQNSRENQITPWSNDPVSDPSGECFYILDRENQNLWSPTALPIRVENASYITYHGQGYSRFQHLSHELYSELTQFVPWDLPVKVSLLKLENRSKFNRWLSISSYVEWVLGFNRGTMAPTTVTELDAETNAIFAYNPRSNEYGHKISFAAFRDGHDSFTADRTEFIGRNGALDAPGSLFKEAGFSKTVGANLDPCAAFQTHIELEADEETELVFFVGQANSREEARAIISKLRNQSLAAMLSTVQKNWDEILEKVQVETPDLSMDLMLNRWLLYQTTVCRFWARAAFYQAGGAFGFRDQLQDVMALMVSQPTRAKEHILRAAQRQFLEGDVQHWWHPPFGRGVRTHFSDDLLWLPYTVAHYLDTTGDRTILDERVPFLEGPPLREDQEDSYYTPNVSHNTATLYEHCVRALERSLKVGSHGLPLMGAGDWNDGMNRVGQEGKGESVWMAWFLYTNLLQFSEVADQRGDQAHSERWLSHALSLQFAAEENAWDGDWYRRAYFDDGTPLGSHLESECRIDSLSQTWAVISGAADPERAAKAMNAVERYLVREDQGMILLFTPPFDKTPHDPGYIKGYLPGVRENGGQYTHAAIWCVIAFALMNENKKAYDLFRMLNPVNHALTPEARDKYKVEPYVLAADIYGVAPYQGRGGWTWYTGSCGWMYRAGIESILGLQVRANTLFLKPCIPPEWPEYRVKYRHGRTDYEIHFHNPSGRPDEILEVLENGARATSLNTIALVDDGGSHRFEILLGSRDVAKGMDLGK
jgi:cyclic beta-1,2-glucan synthetase